MTSLKEKEGYLVLYQLQSQMPVKTSSSTERADDAEVSICKVPHLNFVSDAGISSDIMALYARPLKIDLPCSQEKTLNVLSLKARTSHIVTTSQF